MGSHNNPYSSSQSIELTLSLKPSYVPKSIADLFNDLATIESVNERLTILNEYLNKYKEELSRVETLKRDLPQCMLHLLDAIAMINEKIMRMTTNIDDKDQDLFEFENNKALVAEFLAWKKRVYENDKNLMNLNSPPDSLSPSLDDHNDLNTNQPLYKGKRKEKDIMTDHPHKEISPDHYFPPANSWKNTSRNYIESDHIRGGSRATRSAENSKAKSINQCNSLEADYNYNNNTNNNSSSDNDNKLEEPFDSDPTWKGNTRRTWTPELHARFVQALNHIGGPEVATPKQIRDVMRVKGLTNDQVKSHLQKYRLHLRVAISRADHQIQTDSGDNRNPAAGARYDPYISPPSGRPIPGVPAARYASSGIWINDHQCSSSATASRHHDPDDHHHHSYYSPSCYVPDHQPPPPPPQYEANLARTSAAASGDYEEDYGGTDADSSFAGWRNRFRASGDRF